MKVTKVKPGIYKVKCNGNTVMIAGGPNYNPESPFYRRGGWEAWSCDDREKMRDDNCWACGAPSKKVLLDWIKEEFKPLYTRS